MPGLKKYNYKIVAHTYTNTIDTIATNVDSLELIPLLKNIKNFIDRKYASVDIIRMDSKNQKDETKFIYKVGLDKDWVAGVSKSLKLGQPKEQKFSHSYIVSYAIYGLDKKSPVFQHDYPQSTVINSEKLFQNVVFEKMFDMQQKLRVAVLRVYDVTTDKDDSSDKNYTPLYSHVIYPSHDVTPDLTGTGVHIRHNSGKHDRCTPVIFNKKIHQGIGGDKIYFVNQGDAIRAVQAVIDEIKKYGKRNLKENGK